MLVLEYKLKKKTKGGVTAISLVDMPAVMVDFLKLQEEIPSLKLSLDEDQMVITGPVLIPNQKIYRSAESLGLDVDGYIYFSEETVKEMSELFMTNMRMNNITLDHEVVNEDLSLIETWLSIDKDKDKSTALGFDLPKGTWFATYKVNNVDLWANIKGGKYNGFSIEAYDFEKEVISLAKEDEIELNEEDKYDILYEYINNIIPRLKQLKNV